MTERKAQLPSQNIPDRGQALRKLKQGVVAATLSGLAIFAAGTGETKQNVYAQTIPCIQEPCPTWPPINPTVPPGSTPFPTFPAGTPLPITPIVSTSVPGPTGEPLISRTPTREATHPACLSCTPIAENTATQTLTPTASASRTATAEASATASATRTKTPAPTSTRTEVPTATETPLPSFTPFRLPTETPTSPATRTPGPSATPAPIETIPRPFPIRTQAPTPGRGVQFGPVGTPVRIPTRFALEQQLPPQVPPSSETRYLPQVDGLKTDVGENQVEVVAKGNQKLSDCSQVDTQLVDEGGNPLEPNSKYLDYPSNQEVVLCVLPVHPDVPNVEEQTEIDQNNIEQIEN